MRRHASRRLSSTSGSSHCGELVGFDAFYVGRLAGAKDPIWQLSAIDCYSSYAWAELIACPSGQPRSERTSRFAHRVAADLKRAGWRLERALTDNGNEWRALFTSTIEGLGATQTRIRANASIERVALDAGAQALRRQRQSKRITLTPSNVPTRSR